MLLEICYKDKTQSLYRCDRCKKVCKLNECKPIYTTNENRKAVKKWDLCLRCYEALERGVGNRK